MLLIGVGIVLGVYWLLRPVEVTPPEPVEQVSGPEAPTSILPVEEETPPTPPPEPVLEKPAPDEPELALPPLGKSDPLVRQLVGELSSHPRLVAWLVSEGLIEKVTVIVVNIAEGVSPTPHLDFLAPQEGFSVTGSEESGLYMDPRSYERYNLAADVFASLDTLGTARLYTRLKPLVDQAYWNLGYPDEDFDDALLEAIRELLAVPVLEGRVAVSPLVITYEFADPELESLGAAQRQFLRMGPRNVRKTQAKLRELASALGIPPSRAP